MKQLFTLLFVLSGYFISAQTFTDMGAVLPQLSFSIAAFGDCDNDGDLDLFISGMDNSASIVGGLYIYDGGSYTFSTTSTLPPVYMGAAVWGDIDNDNDLDLVIVGQDASYTDISKVFINNNDGTFTDLSSGITPIEQGDVTLSDFNNDSYLDISITGVGVSERVTKLYKNNGNNTFSELTNVNLPGMNNGEIGWGDYNNDNYPDFILSGFDDNTGGTDTFYTKIFTNNGDETFTESGIPIHQGWLGDVEWGDYNADGNLDFVISGTGGSGADRFTLLYKNNGDSTFTELDPGFAGVSHSSLEWGDFDNDGDLDLFLVGVTTTPGDGNNIATIYTNEGGDTFTDTYITTFNASYFGDADSGDIDGDGKIDIVITGYDDIYTPKSAVYKNNTGLTITNLNIEWFDIYPNPTIDKKLNIICNKEIANTSNNEISIYNMNAVKVFYYKMSRDIGISKEVDLSGLKAGVYLLEFKSGHKLACKKLVVE